MKKKIPKFKIAVTSSGESRGWEQKGLKRGFNGITNVHIQVGWDHGCLFHFYAL